MHITETSVWRKRKAILFYFILFVLFFPFKNEAPYAVKLPYYVQLKKRDFHKISEVHFNDTCISFSTKNFFIRSALNDKNKGYDVLHLKYSRFRMKLQGFFIRWSSVNFAEFKEMALKKQKKNGNQPFKLENQFYFFDINHDVYISAAELKIIQLAITSLHHCERTTLATHLNKISSI